MKDMLDKHKSSDEKAYFIRNLNKIENPTEFFELIGKTSSSVLCTADGLLINNNIVISPLRIQAFTDVRNESLCYRINIKDVKEKLVDFASEANPSVQSFTDLENMSINGKKIFKGMRTQDFDRLNRVFSTCSDAQCRELFEDALKIEQDKRFHGNESNNAINTPNDFVSIIELIYNEKVSFFIAILKRFLI